MNWLDRFVVWMLPRVPQAWIRKAAARYIAGEDIESTLKVLTRLQAEGSSITLDVVGEDATHPMAAEAALVEYLVALDGLHRSGAEGYLSIKPSQFGLQLDPELCFGLVRRLCEAARVRSRFVRLDMEGSALTDATLNLYERLREAGYAVGVVLQAALARTPADIDRLLPLRPDVRLCKGIYLEPWNVAWREPDTIRAAFLHNLEKLLTGGARVRVATHDEYLIHGTLALVDRYRISPKQWDFEMLLGVRTPLRLALLSRGIPVRVYVPYGRDAHMYALRRLRENPSVAGHVFRAWLGKE